MQRWKLVLALMLAVSFGRPAMAEKKPLIDWNGLKNPVLSYPNWSVKDTAMAYRNGTFYVFFSAFYAERGQVRSHVVEVSTADFKHYSEPIFNFDGEDDRWIGMCSPDVQQLYGKYVMTFNSWGDKPGKPNQLFYMTSDSLVGSGRMNCRRINRSSRGYRPVGASSPNRPSVPGSGHKTPVIANRIRESASSVHERSKILSPQDLGH